MLSPPPLLRVEGWRVTYRAQHNQFPITYLKVSRSYSYLLLNEELVICDLEVLDLIRAGARKPPYRAVNHFGIRFTTIALRVGARYEYVASSI